MPFSKPNQKTSSKGNTIHEQNRNRGRGESNALSHKEISEKEDERQKRYKKKILTKASLLFFLLEVARVDPPSFGALPWFSITVNVACAYILLCVYELILQDMPLSRPGLLRYSTA